MTVGREQVAMDLLRHPVRGATPESYPSSRLWPRPPYRIIHGCALLHWYSVHGNMQPGSYPTPHPRLESSPSLPCI